MWPGESDGTRKAARAGTTRTRRTVTNAAGVEVFGAERKEQCTPESGEQRADIREDGDDQKDKTEFPASEAA